MAEESAGFKSRKGILKSVILNENMHLSIHDAVLRMHKMTILAYQFIKAYYLHCFEQQLTLPTIDKNFIKLVFGIISTIEKASNRKFTGGNQLIVDQLRLFYNSHFRSVSNFGPISRDHLTQVIDYASTIIKTMIDTNIKVHYFKRLNGFVNKVWLKVNEAYIESLPTKTAKNDFKHQLRLKLKKVKDDLINGTLTSEPFFHGWIQSTRPLIIPSNIVTSVPYDVKDDPMKFLPGMIIMNRILEEIGAKQFHCFPLRSEIVPCHIDIDTATLGVLTGIPGKEFSGKGAIETLKPRVWGSNFNLSNSLFKPHRGFNFHHMIRTDGVSIVVLFSPIGYNKWKKRGPSVQPSEYIEESADEFPYLDKLPLKEVQRVRNAHLVYVDPNKGNLIYCIDDANKVFRYTRFQRIHETKRALHQKKIQKYKNENGLVPIETQLGMMNSRTCYLTRFMQYVAVKNQVNSQLFVHYQQEFFRKMRLTSFIETKRSEANLINRIKKVYQTDEREVVLIYGDCNVGYQMKHVISTPMIGMKRRLAKEFKVVHIDEYRTSCLDWKTGLRNENVRVAKADGGTKKLHSVLVSTIPNRGSTGWSKSFINRDRNAVLNMRKITHQFLIDRTRPVEYRRTKSFQGLTLKLIATDALYEKPLSSHTHIQLIN